MDSLSFPSLCDDDYDDDFYGRKQKSNSRALFSTTTASQSCVVVLFRMRVKTDTLSLSLSLSLTKAVIKTLLNTSFETTVYYSLYCPRERERKRKREEERRNTNSRYYYARLLHSSIVLYIYIHTNRFIFENIIIITIG